MSSKLYEYEEAYEEVISNSTAVSKLDSNDKDESDRDEDSSLSSDDEISNELQTKLDQLRTRRARSERVINRLDRRITKVSEKK